MLSEQEMRMQAEQAQKQIEQRQAMYAQLQQQSLKKSSEKRGTSLITPTLTQCSDKLAPLTEFIGVVTSDDPKAAPYNPPEPVPCEYCGALRYTKGIVLKNRIMWIPTGPETCSCQEAQIAKLEAVKAKEEERLAAERAAAAGKKRERVIKIIGKSGLGERFRHRTFEAFNKMPENINAYKTAQGYAANFDRLQENPTQYEKNGLLFTGPKGTGKTHLAASIANKLMADGVPIIFITMIDLLGKIKSTFDADRTTANEAELMQLYKNVDLLIIDDMGKELPTAWALSKMYEIINARYEDYKPIIVTSNYTADELVRRLTPKDGDKTTADATVDRIIEMTYTAPLAGESWRSKK